jgi:DNA polymerase-1
VIRQYCEYIGWPHKLVTTEADLAALMEVYAADHLKWRRERDASFRAEWAPEHFLPEDEYCILIKADKQNLKLRMLRGQLPRELVQAIIEYSTYRKRSTSFGLKFMQEALHADGTIKTEFHQAITTTGRISTTPNIQNQPRDPRYRACFRARPGYKLVIADYSAIEPRLTAEVTQDPTYVSTFLEGKDIYVSMAFTLTGELPDKHTPEGAIKRQEFKVVVLSKAYRAGAAKLRDQLTLSLEKLILAGEVPPPTLEQAKLLDQLFKERCAEVVRFQDACEQYANPTSARKVWDRFLKAPVTWVEAPCGRKRFFGPDAKNTFTESSNAPIQGASATMMKAAACLVQRDLDAGVDGVPYDAHCVNLVHDEGIWEVRADQAEAVGRIVKRRMEEAGAFYVRSVPVIAEFPEGSTTGVVSVWSKKDDTALEEE